ncbi:hypothetical protein [Streptosporangium sp. NPDC023615]|uniref:hypothetical protein n=1 Tax=Streptosporangium sp. NPDC023615 TaxID=3154794 RepID=UPI003430BD82
MGYVLNLQGRNAGASGDEPASIISSVSVGVACAASTVSLSGCLGGSNSRMPGLV